MNGLSTHPGLLRYACLHHASDHLTNRHCGVQGDVVPTGCTVAALCQIISSKDRQFFLGPTYVLNLAVTSYQDKLGLAGVVPFYLGVKYRKPKTSILVGL